MSKVYCGDCQYYPEDLAYYCLRQRTYMTCAPEPAKCRYEPETVDASDWFAQCSKTVYALCHERNVNNDCPHWTLRTSSSYWSKPEQPKRRWWQRRK